MRKTSETRSADELWKHYIEQLPMIAALLWEEGTAQDAAKNAAELIEACMEEAEHFAQTEHFLP
jgi:hypothetical protein